ncbi:MAG: hypothetical protein H7145_22650, partial [Akkermansiaceae bacterium]|nr:hypothetical protein [Armatimonadota bacterium]
VPTRTDPKQTVTVHIKGALARVEFRPMGARPESAPSTVLLYDGMAQKVYALDATAKTYYVQSYKEAIDGERRRNAGADDGVASRMTFTGNVDLKAARANNAFVSKEIIGTKTRQYLVSGNVEVKFNMPEGGGPPAITPQGAGGFPDRGAGVPGTGEGRRARRPRGQGGLGGQSGPGGGFTPPSLAVDGEVWSTDGIALFSAGRDTPVAAIYRLMLPENAGAFGGSLTKPLVTRLKNMKSLPGESTVSFRMSSNLRNTANGDNAPAETPLTTRLVLKAMKTDATLEDALFAIPTGFTEKEQPADFGRPGGGRAPGGGGRRFGGNQGNEQ